MSFWNKNFYGMSYSHPHILWNLSPKPQGLHRGHKGGAISKVISRTDWAPLEPLPKLCWTSPGSFLTHIGQKCSLWYSPYNTLINHPTFRRNFLYLEAIKLATNPLKESTLASLSGGQPSVLAETTFSLPFILNKPTPFCDTLCLEILFQPTY